MNKIKKNVSLKEKTSVKIGGDAREYFLLNSEDELYSLSGYFDRDSLSVFILGNGSNIVVSESGWPGLVIDTSNYSGTVWDDGGVYCRSGTRLNYLVKETVERGFSSMANLCGIPGALGGALIMNAGAFGQQISDTLVYVDVFGLKKKRKLRLYREELEFKYRYSSLKEKGCIITGAYFSMDDKPGVSESRAVLKETLEKRKEKHPLEFPSCGSVFKRPENDFAGRLIENCGLKGKSIGNAEVSLKHANFIINRGRATADEFRELVVYIQKSVFKKAGIILEPEVHFIGRFKIPLFNSKEK